MSFTAVDYPEHPGSSGHLSETTVSVYGWLMRFVDARFVAFENVEHNDLRAYPETAGSVIEFVGR